MTIRDFLKHYALCRDVTADYIEQLAIAVKRLETFAGKELELTDLTDELVNRWIIHVQTTQARITAKDKRRCLLTLWKAAAEEGLCKPHGRIRPVKVPEQIVEGWSAADASRLLQSALAMKGNQRKVGIPKALYWSSYIMAAWDSALRLGDTLSLQRGDIWPAPNGAGLFTRIQGKTGRAIRLRLRAETMQAIDASMAHGGQRSLIWPLGGFREAWYRQFKRLVKKAGLNGTSRYIRRGASSEAEALQPGAGSRLLGHRDNGETFARHYSVDRIVAADMPLPPALGNGGRKEGAA
jgi:integrase